MGKRVGRSGLMVIILAGVVLVAVGLGALWLSASRRSPVPSTDEMLRRAGVTVLDDEAPVSFPEINVWEAPSWPVGAGRVLGERSPSGVLSASFHVSAEMYPELQAAAGKTDEELWESVVSAARQAGIEPPCAKQAPRRIAAMWQAWAVHARGRDAQPVWLVEGPFVGTADRQQEKEIERQPLECWPELVIRNGIVWWDRKAMQGRPASAYAHRPLHPKAGQKAMLGGSNTLTFTRRVTVRVNGATFRSWVLEGAWTEGSMEERHVLLYAPGIGEILNLAWIREVRPGRSFGTKVNEELLVYPVEELLVPEKGIYWTAAHGSEP